MRSAIYLFFNGDCREAMTHYQRILGGRIETMIENRGSPAESRMPPDWGDKILHASLVYPGGALMASDAPPGRDAPMGGFSISLSVESVEEARRVFDALAEGGSVTMPLEKTFWSEAFGMVRDRHGVPWMISGPSAETAG